MIQPMAKGKKPAPKKAKKTQVTLRDLLRPVVPKLIEALMRRGRIKTQVEFAQGFPDANTVHRYIAGHVVPTLNLPAIGARVGLSPGQTGWFLGKLMMEEYDAFRFDTEEGRQGEIREQEPRYDERSLALELEAMMALDFRPLGASRTLERNLSRNRLRHLCEVTQDRRRLRLRRSDRP